MIEFHGVEKEFPGRGGGAAVKALDGIDLSVGRGEIFGIIGRSGAGKSTLIRVVNMLERPTSGRVVVDGVDMNALDNSGLRAARRGIGMIFQHFNLLSSRTVYDNVALPLELAGLKRSEIRAKVEPLLELVGLGDKRDRYPAELSGGQKQRVGIARALSSEPKVLLCDEATSALDPETTTSILRLLADINAKLGLTIVLITHEMAVIKEICHRVAVWKQAASSSRATCSTSSPPLTSDHAELRVVRRRRRTAGNPGRAAGGGAVCTAAIRCCASPSRARSPILRSSAS